MTDKKNEAPAVASVSPGRRAWRRFRRNPLGFWSLVIFSALVVLSLFADVLSTDKPLIVRYEGQTYFPVLRDYSEKTFGGDFETPADYLDPFIEQRITQGGNWAIYAPNRYGPGTLNYFSKPPNPAAPSGENLLGTDERGRDLLAQLIYGFRVSVLFALALTVIGVVLGVATGAVQGDYTNLRITADLDLRTILTNLNGGKAPRLPSLPSLPPVPNPTGPLPTVTVPSVPLPSVSLPVPLPTSTTAVPLPSTTCVAGICIGAPAGTTSGAYDTNLARLMMGGLT